MTIAVISGRISGTVLEVTQNEAASLEAMAAYAGQGYRQLRRVVVRDADFVAWSNGADLVTDGEYNPATGKIETILVSRS